MKVTVKEQMKKFWLAAKSVGWMGVYGFEIQIDEYRFAVIGANGKLVLSEVTSGIRVGVLEIPDELREILNSKERLLHFLQKVVAHVLIDFVEDTPFITEHERMREEVFELYGKMPPIEDVDEDLLLAPDSEILN